jgi:hypothetical protein
MEGTPAMNGTPEGTIEFWAKHDHPEWFSNSQGYNFPTIKSGSIEVASAKNPDRTIRVSVNGLPAGPLEFIHPIPECGPKGLFVVVTWTPKRVTLFLNGNEVHHFDVTIH